jgi:hypothetical protein
MSPHYTQWKRSAHFPQFYLTPLLIVCLLQPIFKIKGFTRQKGNKVPAAEQTHMIA